MEVHHARSTTNVQVNKNTAYKAPTVAALFMKSLHLRVDGDRSEHQPPADLPSITLKRIAIMAARDSYFSTTRYCPQ
jgi:hypothetical protein